MWSDDLGRAGWRVRSPAPTEGTSGTGLTSSGGQRAAFPAGCLALQRLRGAHHLQGTQMESFSRLGSWVTSPSTFPSQVHLNTRNGRFCQGLTQSLAAPRLPLAQTLEVPAFTCN